MWPAVSNYSNHSRNTSYVILRTEYHLSFKISMVILILNDLRIIICLQSSMDMVDGRWVWILFHFEHFLFEIFKHLQFLLLYKLWEKFQLFSCYLFLSLFIFFLFLTLILSLLLTIFLLLAASTIQFAILSHSPPLYLSLYFSDYLSLSLSL